MIDGEEPHFNLAKQFWYAWAMPGKSSNGFKGARYVENVMKEMWGLELHMFGSISPKEAKYIAGTE